MPSRWCIPKEVEIIVLKRDLKCLYCGNLFNDSNITRKTKRTWEHIINYIKINGPENIALCCGSCNASKGNKSLCEWLRSKYCETKGITKDSVASIAKKHLEKNNV